tara:strand:- start:22230 stop:22796 length:567 start_codon:yes stop_codon:yes gene_type:complete
VAGLRERKLAITADLHWSLEEMRAKELGKQFLLNLSEFLPVYSPALRQVYADYDTYFTKTSVVILPDPADFTTTYSHIPEKSVKATGLLLHPTPDGVGVNLRLRNQRSKTLPLETAFQLVRKQLRGPFLPVVKRGDLRDFDQLTPCLHLNALALGNADTLSRFERIDIANALEERVEELVLAAHLLGV